MKDRLAQKRQKLKERSQGGDVVFLKEGTTRIRILPTVSPDGEEADFSMEVVHFYLGSKVRGVFSASTVGKPCPIMDHYQELKETDKDAAKNMAPRKKYFVPAVVFEDEAGKKIDKDRSGKLVFIPSTGLLTQMLDYYLDPELGEFNDPDEGYDLKIKRTGTGKLDTEYSLTPCKSTPLHKDYRKPIVLREMVEKVFLSEDEALSKLAEYLEDEGEPAPKEEKSPERKPIKKLKKPRD